MHEPKVNQVWITKSDRFCLIVEDFTHDDLRGKLAMLWRDEINGQWTVVEIENRLDTLTDMNPATFFIHVEKITKGIALSD